MASQTCKQAHQSAPELAGTWKLVAGRALTLRPGEPGVLGIARGSVWATADGPHHGPLNDRGDRFLHPGEQMTLRLGQRLVIEAGDRHRPAYFSWDPIEQRERRPIRAAAWAQPLEDLRLAAVLGANAAGRLLAALAGLPLEWSRRERPSRPECAFNAHSSACRAQGAIN